MNKKIVIINGTATCGKDTFCRICNEYIPSKSISTVDKVKEAYRLLGWKGDKTEQHRKALSDIKDIGTKNLDHPYNFMKGEIKRFRHSDYDILFIHSREPDEIARFVKEFGCITLLIRNPNIEAITSNHADAEVENYDYDYIIDNNYIMEDFEQEALKFIEWLKERD